MKAIQAAALLGVAMVEGQFEVGTKDDGKTISLKYTGKDLDQEGDLLAAVLYLADLDGLKVTGLTTDRVHVDQPSPAHHSSAGEDA